MPGRILNFSEFFDKYSKDGGKDDHGIDTLTNAAANFEEGFDSETYDQNQIGPNRPVAGGSDATPPQPGQSGAPKFTSAPDASMDAPEELEEPAEEESEMPEETEETEEPTENEAPQAEDEATEETEDTGDDTPEPESDSDESEENDKKEEKEMKESKFTGVKGFSQFVNENYGSSMMSTNPFEEGEEDYHEHDDHDNYDRFEEEEICPGCGMPEDRCECEHHEEMDTCDKCGEPMIDFGAGPECGCNM